MTRAGVWLKLLAQTEALDQRPIAIDVLAFEVIQHRLEHEYNATCRYESISLHKACWIESDNKVQIEDFRKRKFNNLAVDKHGREVFLADSPYSLQMAQEKFPDVQFHVKSEF